MPRSRRLLFSFSALLFLATLVAACGDRSPAPGETGAPSATAPATQPPATEFISPLPTPTDTPGAQTGVQPVSPVPIEITPPAQSLPSRSAPLTGEVPQELLDAVFDDLVERQGESREAIAVERAGAVVWRDGSLGCPQPGMMYTQALVPGYQIVLSVSEQTFDYHASEWGSFVLCPAGMAEEGLPPPGEGGLVDQ